MFDLCPRAIVLSLFDYKDYEKAHYYIKKGIELGNAPSYRYLAEAYEKGLGVKKSMKEAFNYYKEAVLKGDTFSTTNYANLCLEGYGKSEDIDRAIQLLLPRNTYRAYSSILVELYIKQGSYRLAYSLVNTIPNKEEKEKLTKILKKKLKIK